MNSWIYIFTAAAVSFLVRALPITVFRKPVRNRFIQSFLYYMPYVTLSVMTFPAILHGTESLYGGLAALIAGVIAAWLGRSLLETAGICTLAALLLEIIF